MITAEDLFARYYNRATHEKILDVSAQEAQEIEEFFVVNPSMAWDEEKEEWVEMPRVYDAATGLPLLFGRPVRILEEGLTQLGEVPPELEEPVDASGDRLDPEEGEDEAQ